MSDTLPYKQKIEALHQRLVRNLSSLNENFCVPAELKGLITIEELYDIYQTLTLPTNRTYLELQLKTGQPHRLSKEVSALSRSLNFIIDPITQDIYLMLETKRKTIAGKDFSIEVFSGTEKSIKSAWRIDGDRPEQYVNAVFYAPNDEDIDDAYHEAFLSQKIQTPLQTRFVSLIIAGEPINKNGERCVRSSNSDMVYLPYQNKISLYSKWAQEGTLGKLLDKKTVFSLEKSNHFTFITCHKSIT